jgi:hypothetical protein
MGDYRELTKMFSAVLHETYLLKERSLERARNKSEYPGNEMLESDASEATQVYVEMIRLAERYFYVEKKIGSLNVPIIQKPIILTGEKVTIIHPIKPNDELLFRHDLHSTITGLERMEHMFFLRDTIEKFGMDTKTPGFE